MSDLSLENGGILTNGYFHSYFQFLILLSNSSMGTHYKQALGLALFMSQPLYIEVTIASP